MSADLIFTREKTLGRAELETDRSLIKPTFAGHEVTVLADDGPFEDLEGTRTEGTVSAELPGMEAARAWCAGPACREVREHRFLVAVHRGDTVDRGDAVDRGPLVEGVQTTYS